MKLYQEYGVSPLGGCLPVLLQFPILIAMYSVIRAPVPYAPDDPAKPANVTCEGPVSELLPECYANNHLPVDSQLFHDVTNHENQGFLFMNLQCPPARAGREMEIQYTNGEPSGQVIDCGDSIPDRIPYYALLALMIGATYYSVRQTQKSTPASAQNPQTAMISRIMPITFGIFGYTVPAGLVLYWTMSSLFQIGQQAVMLRLGHIGPEAMERRLEQVRAKAEAKGGRQRTGFMGQMLQRADQERQRRGSTTTTARKPPPRTPKKGSSGGTTPPKPSSGGTQGHPKSSGRNRPKRRGR
jgi:YidC/Oxa1 family membrane protein insertase